ncbi:hypothetical protein, partial [Pseudomonas savastanoi]|uniref:hypothetical protein n=1 Tax=Pseudomonas savastanoi TaxID=29438 RepID=UPI001F28DB27
AGHKNTDQRRPDQGWLDLTDECDDDTDNSQGADNGNNGAADALTASLSNCKGCLSISNGVSESCCASEGNNSTGDANNGAAERRYGTELLDCLFHCVNSCGFSALGK